MNEKELTSIERIQRFRKIIEKAEERKNNSSEESNYVKHFEKDYNKELDYIIKELDLINKELDELEELSKKEIDGYDYWLNLHNCYNLVGRKINLLSKMLDLQKQYIKEN